MRSGTSSIYLTTDMFSDENIDNMISTYRFDYAKIMHMVALFVDPGSLPSILSECGIPIESFFNPTEEQCETLRQRIINGRRIGR